jgi:hypothetical protein
VHEVAGGRVARRALEVGHEPVQVQDLNAAALRRDLPERVVATVDLRVAVVRGHIDVGAGGEHHHRAPRGQDVDVRQQGLGDVGVERRVAVHDPLALDAYLSQPTGVRQVVDDNLGLEALDDVGPPLPPFR